MRATHGQRLAAFLAAKHQVAKMIGFFLTDDEIHQISDAALEAALVLKDEERKDDDT